MARSEYMVSNTLGSAVILALLGLRDWKSAYNLRECCKKSRVYLTAADISSRNLMENARRAGTG
jgi:hypothetical protein